MQKNKKNIVKIMVVCIIVACVFSLILFQSLSKNKNNQLINSGNTYEEKLRNIHNTYSTEFYKYINDKNIFEQKFIGYDKSPSNQPWKFSLTCKEKKKDENLMCYSSIIFKENTIKFNMSHFPKEGTSSSETYNVSFELYENEFTNFEVESNDRWGEYALCTFKDIKLEKPIKEEEYKTDPNFGDPFEYGRVNCYEEGKRYQKIVPELKSIVEKTEENIKELIKLSEEFKLEYKEIVLSK